MFYSSGGPFICFLRLALPCGKPQIPNSHRLQLGDGRGSKVETMKKGSVIVGTGDLANQPLSSVFEPLSNPSEDTR